jgi:hypothetical protein
MGNWTISETQTRTKFGLLTIRCEDRSRYCSAASLHTHEPWRRFLSLNLNQHPSLSAH